VIGHEAEGVDPTFELLFPLGQVVEVVAVIIIAGKNRLTVVAALDDVVGVVG
jgi:hypothetical protein